MYNIPSNDPGVVLVRGPIKTVCEWLVRLAGQIATCVEAAEDMADYIVTSGRIPASAAEDQALAQDLINRGQASANGATNYLAASEQMTRLGIPNRAYGADWFAANDFVPVVQAAIRAGIPVLLGVYAALKAYDDWTHSPEDAGVYGHGITLVGFDATGAIVADPNTSQAENGDFVHYSWATLRNMGGQYPSMVIPEGLMATPLDGYFDIGSDGSYTLKSSTAIKLGGGEVALYVQLDAVIGLPEMEMSYALQGKYKDPDIAFRKYERGVIVYDPNHVKDDQIGMGAFYLGKIDDPDFGVDPGAAAVATAALQAEVTSLQQQLAQVQSTLSQQAHDALTAVAALKTALAD